MFLFPIYKEINTDKHVCETTSKSKMLNVKGEGWLGILPYRKFL